MNAHEPVITPPGQDSRIMAALAHVTALLPLMGVIAPIVIWATQKDKSRYVAFQALQALVYQLVMVVAWFVGMGCYMCSAFSPLLSVFAVPASTSPGGEGPLTFLFFLPFLLPFAVLGIILVGGIAFVVYGLVGAVSVLRGKEFHYAIIGPRLERYLEEGRETNQPG